MNTTFTGDEPILILSSHLCLGLPEGLFPVGVLVKILKELQPFLHSLVLITLPTTCEGPHCVAVFTPHCHPSWAQIIVSGSCFQIPLACVPPLI